MSSELRQRPQRLVSNWRQTPKGGGKPAIASIPAKHAERCPSVPKGSAPGSPTRTFILKTNTWLYLRFAFSGPDPGKQTSAGPVPGRGVRQHGCGLPLSLCLPLAALFPPNPERCTPRSAATLGIQPATMRVFPPASRARTHSPRVTTFTENLRAKR